MVLTPFIQQQNNDCTTNPSITLTNSRKISGEDYVYPDPNSCFVISEVGKNYRNVSINSVLLNPKKGYYVYKFTMETFNPNVISASNKLFSHSVPITGKPLIALQNALKASAKKTTSLPNRL